MSRTLRPAFQAAAAPRWLAAGLWLLAGLSASYWGLHGWGDAELASVPAPAAERTLADPRAVARGLGAGVPVAAEPAPADASRHVLLGVVRAAGGRGAALIATDGQPPKPYRVGAALPGGLLLRELTPREAWLGPAEGEATQRLSLPPRR
ncbi:type II secretion system protein N [Malikia sp.]|uniref:type II secretion system protein N n=1 Tax=Malikia sp. TaxID=2070706 RepID=UPI0026107CE7|nr:type II secretion system protein N [Malikia sp.]MDD2730318.1 type II secretion system protein N [Malikia sp.]